MSKSTSVTTCTFDPRQPDHWKLSSEAMEKLRCDVLSLNQPCAFLDILVPLVHKIRHDHTHSMPSRNEVENVNAEADDEPEQIVPHYPWGQYELDVKLALNVSLEEWERIEIETRDQSSQQHWYIVWSKHITGSNCERILNQKQKPVSLLRQCLYPKPLDPPPAPIAWGQYHQSVAIIICERIK